MYIQRTVITFIFVWVTFIRQKVTGSNKTTDVTKLTQTQLKQYAIIYYCNGPARMTISIFAIYCQLFDTSIFYRIG